MDQPVKIDADHPLPIGERDLLHQAAARHTGVVAEDVDVAEGCKGPRRSFFELFADRNVGANVRNAIAIVGQTMRGGVQRCLLDVGHHHVHAAIEKRARQPKPDAACRTGNKRGFARELPHLHSSPGSRMLAGNRA